METPEQHPHLTPLGKWLRDEYKEDMTKRMGASLKEAMLDAQPDTSKAKTDDGAKPPLAMLPWAGIREVAHVQAYGHKKYGDFHNFRKGIEVSRNLSCAVRHISDFMDGQDLDSESGRNHLAHAACRLLFTLQNINDGVAIDDRYKKQT
jgi:hypothetical protein